MIYYKLEPKVSEISYIDGLISIYEDEAPSKVILKRWVVKRVLLRNMSEAPHRK